MDDRDMLGVAYEGLCMVALRPHNPQEGHDHASLAPSALPFDVGMVPLRLTWAGLEGVWRVPIAQNVTTERMLLPWCISSKA